MANSKLILMLVLFPLDMSKALDLENISKLETPTLDQIRAYGGQPYLLEEFVEVFNEGTLHLDHYYLFTKQALVPDVGPGETGG